MAININQLTSELRMMPDQALQRMAMMYKQDPYIFPMIISEDMARKKMRAASQVQMAQPQPKVVDQALMAMAPQEAGIAQLPTPNMQNMADGGIAGQADEVEFSERSEPVVRMAGGGVPGYKSGGDAEGRSIYDLDRDPLIQKLRGIVPDDELARMDRAALVDTIEKLAAAGKDVATYPGRVAANLAEQFITRPLRAAGLPVPYLPQSFYGGDRSSATPYMDRLAAQQAAQNAPAGGARSAGIGGPRAGEREAYEAMMAGTPQPGASGAAPGAGAGAPSRAPSAGTGAAVPTGGGVGMPSVESAKRTAAEFLDAKAAEKQLADYQKSETAAVEVARERRKKAMEDQGKAYTGLEALLKKEEEGAKGELEQSKAMAILNAGLAMMAGSSPRALENIGKGAMVGTGQYAEAMKDFKKSAKERQRALADIEQARRAEARADIDAQLKFEERADERLANARKFGVEGLLNIGIKNADAARQIFTTQVEQQGAMARVKASDPLALYRALGDGNIKRGFEFAQTAKGEPVTKQKLFLEYMKNPLNDPAKFGEYVQQYERQFGPIGFSSGSASQSADQALVNKYLNPPR